MARELCGKAIIVSTARRAKSAVDDFLRTIIMDVEGKNFEHPIRKDDRYTCNILKNTVNAGRCPMGYQNLTKVYEGCIVCITMNMPEMSNTGADSPPLDGVTSHLQPTTVPDEITGFKDALKKMQKAPEEVHKHRRNETMETARLTGLAAVTAFCCSSVLFLLLNDGNQRTIQDLQNRNSALREKVDKGAKSKQVQAIQVRNEDLRGLNFELEILIRRQRLDRSFIVDLTTLGMHQKEQQVIVAKKMPLADDEPPPIK